MYSGYGSSLYGTSSSTKAVSSMVGTGIWTIVAIVIAIIGGIALYFTFLSKKNEGKFTGFLGWTYEFLSFKKMLSENLLKILYLILAIFIKLFSFGLIKTSFLLLLFVLIFGNVITRIIYEFFLIKLMICRNTTEINAKLSKDKEEK